MNKLFTKALGLAAAGAVIVPAALAVASPETFGLGDNAVVRPTADEFVITPPYAEDFTKTNDVFTTKGYTKVENGTEQDGALVQWGYDFNKEEWPTLICPGMYYVGKTGTPVDSDDWLFTPAIKLEAGNKYTYTADLGAYIPQDTEYVEIYVGNAPTVAAMTQTLVANTAITGTRYNNTNFAKSTYKTLKAEFQVPTSGNYYIAVRSCTKNKSIAYSGMILFFYHWNIDAGISKDAPDRVNELSIAANTNGEKSTDISFKTPVKTLGGDPMTALTKAVVERDGTVVREFATPAVGETLTFKDENVADGAHTYKVYAVNDKGNGDPKEQDVFVGVNVPGKVENLKVANTAKVGEVELTWEAPAFDADGYPTNAGTVSYNIYESDGNNSRRVAADVKDTKYTYAVCGENDAQRFSSWYVEASSSKGKAETVATDKYPVGPAMTLPFAESFSGFKFHNAFTQNSLLNGDRVSDGEWQFISTYVEPQDNDGGLIIMQGRRVGDSAELISGRIYMDPKIANPFLTFWYQGMQENNTCGLTVYVKADGETDWTEIHDVTFAGAYWHKEKVDMKDFVGKTIQIRFVGIVGNQASIPIDNIRIGAFYEKNLTAGLLSVAEELSFNTAIPMTLQIENTGNTETGNYTVDFFRNGEKLRTITMNNLQPDETATALYSDRLSVDDERDIEYYAVINYADDQYTDDNTSAKVKCVLKINNYPVPTIKAARQYEDGLKANGEKNFDNIKIKWDAPVASADVEPSVIVENFEDVDNLATEIPGWTMYDQDGRRHVGIAELSFGSITDGPSSFFITDVEELAFSRPFQPVSGDKSLTSLSVYDSASGSKLTDDWAVLPALSGKAQTISFYARSYNIGNLESFEVLTSTTGNEVKDFTKLAEAKDIDTFWTKFEYEVPAGTKYFAIRCISDGKKMLLIDDVTYIPSYSEGLPLMGYNVYCDNVKVNKTLVTDNYFIHKGGKVGDKYTVSAVYFKGESVPSKEFISNTDAIETINADSLSAINVNGNTINVEAEGTVEVYSIDGKVVFRGVANPSVSVEVENGIYVVKAGRETRKVVVR